jgi:hypothetical protein
MVGYYEVPFQPVRWMRQLLNIFPAGPTPIVGPAGSWRTPNPGLIRLTGVGTNDRPDVLDPPEVISVGPLTVKLANVIIIAGGEITFGLDGDTDAVVDVQLPAAFNPPDSGSRAKLIRVTLIATAQPSTPPWIYVVKTASPFRVTLTNPDSANISPALEVNLTYPHSVVR